MNFKILTLKRVSILVFILYVICTLYSAMMLFKQKFLYLKRLVPSEEFKRVYAINRNYSYTSGRKKQDNETLSISFSQNNMTNNIPIVIDIWSKAAIGDYLWDHIIGGDLFSSYQGMMSNGDKSIRNFIFKYITGPGLTPATASRDVENLILVINGRSAEKIQFAKKWLNFLKTLTNLQNVGIVMLGDEKCNNSWIHYYLDKNGGNVKFVYLVYDSPDIDNKVFFQWPLGVATYRNFPKFESEDIDIHKKRKYKCNFIGTLYPNSSREYLMKIIDNEINGTCFVSARKVWAPLETDKSRNDYIDALIDSDLTLSPVGINTECYRIYESLSLGSVPVVEDQMTPGLCRSDESKSSSPLGLLKKYSAPFIYVSNWSEMSNLIKKEFSLTFNDVVKRRIKVLEWYKMFKLTMLNNFMDVIEKVFFLHH